MSDKKSIESFFHDYVRQNHPEIWSEVCAQFEQQTGQKRGLNIGLNLNIKQIETDLESQTTAMIRERVKSMVQRAVADLFYDPNNPYRTGHNSQLSAQESADLGYLRRMVDSALTEVALDPKWDEVAKKVYDENIERYVKEAAERKARHDANKLVFANRGERHKAERQG